VPFKANAERRHHIPKQRHRTTNSATYDAALRQRGSLTLYQVSDSVGSFIADGAYDQGGVYREVAARSPKASVVVPPRSNAVSSDVAQTSPIMRDRHLQIIAEHGRTA